MKVVRSNEYEYLGAINDYHVVRRIASDDIELVHELKYVDPDTGIALMMGRNGIEPTFWTRDNFSRPVIRSFITSLSVNTELLKQKRVVEQTLDQLMADLI